MYFPHLDGSKYVLNVRSVGSMWAVALVAYPVRRHPEKV
jgi:hypothetical protein